ncbi:MAG: EAL domain-containing protein [Lachnospiraceae bacterium]|nr:EAL domain-containing protein [Lachnospiraceae bacterium]
MGINMTDVLFYQNYGASGDVCTITICVICWMLIGSIFTIKHKNLVVFHMANALVCFAAICSIVYHWLIERMTQSTVFWIYTFRAGTYISLILTFVLYIIYISNFIDLEGRTKRIITILNGVGAAVFIVAQISTPFSKLVFYIDENLQIHQNYYLDAFRFAYVYYMLIAGSLLIGNRKKFITKMYKCIRNVMFVSFGLMTIQSFFVSTSIMCITFEFPILAALFLFHYNAYDSDTGTLDAKAFDAYIKDLKNKKFSVICMYLKEINPQKMLALSEEFYHFNEKYFKNPCTFRLNENKMVLVYEDEKNSGAEQKFPVLLEDFDKLYEEFQMDYQIVFIKSDVSLHSGTEYLALNEYLEARMPMNSAYRCNEKDIEAFGKMSYILKELKDIHEKGDLSDERVMVYCQPILNTNTGSYATAETLMRLKLMDIGIVFPDQFVRVAEKYEYIHTLSKIILNKACVELKRIEKMGYEVERISINISVQELRDKNFCDDMIGIINKNGVDYHKIAIELTESKNEKDFENMKKVIQKLHALGIRFYLDDFGTGYSNFERILELPIDMIKFDRSLLLLATKNAESRYMVGSFADIFRRSDYQVLFEGIESDEEEQICRDMSIVYLQGFKYSKPIPMDKLVDFLTTNN